MDIINKAVARLLPFMPPKLIYKMAAKNYIAGPTLKDAVNPVERINSRGAAATIDHPGEEARTETDVFVIIIVKLGYGQIKWYNVNSLSGYPNYE